MKAKYFSCFNMRRPVFFLLVVLFCGCQQQGILEPGESFRVTSFDSDKQDYGGREFIRLNGTVYSAGQMNATIWIHGIMAGRDRIDRKSDIYLKAGFNEFYLRHQLPRCTGCSGIRPGNYSISVEITGEDGFYDAQALMIRMRR